MLDISNSRFKALFARYCIFSILAVSGSVSALDISSCSVGCDYSSIQQALDNSTPGDVIFLSAQTYEENVTIPHDVEIRGAARDASILDGGATGTVITIPTAVSVTITALTVTNGDIDGNGGGISNAGNLIIDDVVITGNTATDGGGGIYKLYVTMAVRQILGECPA